MVDSTIKADDITETFYTVGEVETSVLEIGKLHLPDSANNANKTLLLIIPGNPGVPQFYKDFMQELYKQFDCQIPVWTVGHAGHVQPPTQSLTLADVCCTDAKFYSLQAQIEHKVTFIRENIPSDVSVILVGHSIGCYMILNMLERLPPSQVLHCFMLFPTVERMAVSPNGRKMTPVLRYFRWLSVVAAFFIVVIPERIRRSLISLLYRNIDYPKCLPSALLQILTPWTANFSSYLAKIEMNEVNALQNHLIEKYMKKLSFYYGSCDDWAPSQYFYDLMTSFPDVDAKLCDQNLKHAFVLERAEGKAMAKIVQQWAVSYKYVVLPDTRLQDEDS